jgi:hypothetical protein
MRTFMKLIKRVFLFLTLLISISLTGQDYGVSDFFLKPITYEKLRLMPVTKDFRNYFILQSIENQTNIIIGDFVGAERKIVLIIDENQDNEYDQVYEYYPDTKKFKTTKKPTTELFTNFAQMKKDIINGKIFEENYAYKMQSLKILEEKLKRGLDIDKSRHGHSVKLFDPDKPSTIMGEYFFGRKDGTYDLHFRTNYYKLYHTVIQPPIYYSVYCDRSSDPYIKEIVNKLVRYVE